MTASAKAKAFADKYATVTSEKKHDQNFMRDFLNIFTDENPAEICDWQEDVLNRKGRTGWIDGLVPGKIGFEMKSARKNLNTGYDQIRDYIAFLPHRKKPAVTVVCNFQQFLVEDPDGTVHRFPLSDLHEHLGLFNQLFTKADTYLRSAGKINEEGARHLAALVTHLKESGYPNSDLSQMTQRLLICLYAEDNDVFTPEAFHNFVNSSKKDGSDLGAKLDYLFHLLDQTKAGEQGFAYINGGVFGTPIATAEFDAAGRQLLIDACEYGWTGLDPTIFGNIFEGLMDSEERHDDGIHYTQKDDILDILGPILLNALVKRLSGIKKDKRELVKFLHSLSALHVFDPACGSGNFLLVAYDEMRKLEDKAIGYLQALTTKRLQPSVKLEQFHGIEYKPLAASVAQTSLWLAKVVADQRHRDRFGELAVETFPLREQSDIRVGNSATLDWMTAFPGMNVIVGNPPYVGSGRTHKMTPQQTAERDALGIKGGKIDYASIWMIRAAQYIQANPTTKVGYVIAAALTVGTQVKGVWSHPAMQSVYVTFGRQSYEWPGAANVRVVNMGLGSKPEAIELLDQDRMALPAEYLTPQIQPSPTATRAVAAATLTVPNWMVPMEAGRQYDDYGHYVKLGDDLKDIEDNFPEMLVNKVGAKELLAGKKAPVLRFPEGRSTEAVEYKPIAKRREAVRVARGANHHKRPEWIPTSIVTGDYMVVPRHSSNNYKRLVVVPVSGENYMDSGVHYAKLDWFHAGILMSLRVWEAQKSGAGKIRGDVRLNTRILYGMPEPKNDTGVLREKIAAKAKECVEARRDPAAKCMMEKNMPEDLEALHLELDALVNQWWG